jgi:hypothetical protein
VITPTLTGVPVGAAGAAVLWLGTAVVAVPADVAVELFDDELQATTANEAPKARAPVFVQAFFKVPLSQ